MSKSDYIIREIESRDNEQIKKIVQSVILEMGAPTVGTAYEDKALENMTKVYEAERSIYYVLEYNNKVIGGAGIAQLSGAEDNICELQKMYFLPEARGKGLGSQVIKKCLEKAKDFKFNQCYLETLPYMTAAQELYKKNGFTNIDGPLGNTSHYSCDVWMIKNL